MIDKDLGIIIFCIFSLGIIVIFNTKWWNSLERKWKEEREKEDYRNEVRAFLSAYSRFLANKESKC